ncbi:hypothetical protein GC163_16275 [bacterium]|nr:hypothetical protein [bacterium]
MSHLPDDSLETILGTLSGASAHADGSRWQQLWRDLLALCARRVAQNLIQEQQENLTEPEAQAN